MKRLSRLTCPTLLLASLLPTSHAATATNLAVLGPEAERQWTIASGTFTVAPDQASGKPVLVVGNDKLFLESKPGETGDRELKTLVRLQTETAPTASAIFRVGTRSATDPGLWLALSSTKDAEVIVASVFQDGGALHDVKALTAKLDWDCPIQDTYYYTLRSYTKILPGWPEEYRVRIEHDMAALPDHNHKWLDVRITLRNGQVQFWIDDRLVATKEDASIKADGLARIELSPGVRLATCSLSKLTEPARGYLPIHLGGYANARELTDHAGVATILRSANTPREIRLANMPPQTEESMSLAGIPFVFSGVNTEGNDHLDVGKSLYREGNSTEYMVAYEQPWGGSKLRDSARIQLRIPNGQYDALYLVAASEDKPDTIPLVTAAFFRPDAGFPVWFEGTVPRANARSAGAERVPVMLSNGRKSSLWLVKIPLDPGQLSAFADLDIVEIELTKKLLQYRYYPDPAQYGWHQGGLPSAVHIYAATLGEAPVGYTFSPDRFGHVWTAPETPAYTATVSNHTDASRSGTLTVTTRSYDGTENTKQRFPVTVVGGETVRVPISVPVKLNGYHDISATLDLGGRAWTEKRSFVRLAPDHRSPRWTEGKGALFGYWSYDGGHYTPKAPITADLMTKAGARTATSYALEPSRGVSTLPLVEQHWGRIAGNYFGTPQPWAGQEPVDAAKCDAYQKEGLKAIADGYQRISDPHRPDFVAFFGESVISQRLTSGNYPEFWGEPDYELTAEEKESIRTHVGTARCLAEAFRKSFPDYKILIEWGDPLFVMPLLKAGFPTNLIDGTALDNANFERLPEQQLHQVSLHRLYELKAEYAKRGMTNPLLYYIEGPFFPTEVGSLTWSEQMNIQDRFTLISMAYGVRRFYAGWFAFDNCDWVGAEHYGGCGIQRRIPYCDPKPAYASYATMTEQLNEANFDGWLHTGSLTTYCLRFKGPRGFVYTIWTIRGKRPLTLTLAADTEASVTDSMDNTQRLQSRHRQITIPTGQSVTYLSGAGEVVSAEVGAPDHSDAAPSQNAVTVADLGDGTWHYSSQRDLTYENNDFDTFRYGGRFSSSIGHDAKHGNVLLSTLEKQDKVHELMPWYSILTPKQPIVLKGAPSHIGLWVKGASDWGRVVYCLRDAKGERWISVGTRDQWNCDDIHSWSAFNFDGWRYLRFELPGHAGYDSYRKYGTSWWGSHDGDGVVDLPLTLEAIIVEQRSHVLYVNDVQPVPSNTVAFGKLCIEYQSPADATAEAVRLSRLRMPLPTGIPDLPNPIRELEQSGTGTPTRITSLDPPSEHNDGTSVQVRFQELSTAKTYYVWVSAHPDGRGAVNMTPSGAQSGVSIGDLRPAVPFYFWVTYQDAQSNMSKPSAVMPATLVDTFKEK